MKYLLTLSILLLMTSCSSGVLPKGGGVYTVTTDTFSPATSKQSAFEDAIEYCEKKGKEIKVIASEEMTSNRWNLDFCCE